MTIELILFVAVILVGAVLFHFANRILDWIVRMLTPTQIPPAPRPGKPCQVWHRKAWRSAAVVAERGGKFVIRLAGWGGDYFVRRAAHNVRTVVITRSSDGAITGWPEN
ncbi:MAG: hypothetical protein AAB495_02040 [Patescibacteria group bacterium]